MPKVAAELSALDVKRLAHPGGKRNVLYSVGGVPGLHLQVTSGGGRSWVLRAKVGSLRRDIGLGSFPGVTLSQARDKARDARAKIERGIDPVEQRKAVKAALIAAQRRGLTFDKAAEKCLVAKLEAFKNAKHRQQWENTLATYASPELGKMLVQDITTQDVLRVLHPLWLEKTETASRLRGRIEAVLSWATVAGHRVGDNPARWAGNLKELLPAPSKVATEGNHPAISLDDAKRWFVALQNRDGFGARALEFLALTATRSQEVRGAEWDEIDLDKALWVIPAARMKMGKEHRVPLPSGAKALLEALPRFEDNPLVFPAPRGGKLSDMTLSATMKRMHEGEVAEGRSGFVDRTSKRTAVPHGLRSTFRDWVAERTTFPGDMAEVALAHRISNAVEASYRRGDMIEKRRSMMTAWEQFLNHSLVPGDASQNKSVSK
ncbi:tyrosine-type recombinase/integrase [Seohaeicola nanhaiensis]|uniref:Tyrosine-type recombinase/integrase n=1 Tax=Seohaeicola nanhaiensis TaxID=1387282 RepID=A0ABV9KPJ6_9RHOB